MRELRLRVNTEGPAFDRESQRDQYPVTTEPGITYFAGETEYGTADCLLFYDTFGQLRGVLNHYPFDAPPLETKGSVNIYVDPTWRRRGVATTLTDEARRRWNINIRQQTYTLEGVEFLKAYLNRR